MRKLRPREGGVLSKGEWNILPGTLAPWFLMSFLHSMVIKWCWRSVEDPMQGRFYLLGHLCFSISLSQQPGRSSRGPVISSSHSASS
ncbi:unnamed protein product [Rangifer tarandus platyrhynchus]|uniref:Uncharacterized protein n=2 Tax=Rangifer tarandus platyrhynchus TaxID=3082113 RepID=A0ABN8ZXD4_RANTA|nr:unnamed protein product [Rangifer tarandus platyrhynchus]